MNSLENGFDAEQPVREYRFRFTGKGGEYFSIWIVNLLLSILTLGIYSAWAKVRREQYFHRNTLLDDQPFDYTGNPRSILVGRILALVVIAAGSALQQINVALALGVTLFFALIYPWAVVRSAKFRARNTRYRNIAFHFTGTTGEAFKVYLWLYVTLLPIALFSLAFFPELEQLNAQGNDPDQALAQKVGIGVLAAMAVSLVLFVALWPVYLCRIRSFIHRHLRYGTAQGDFDGTSGAFYRALMRVSGASVVALILIGALGAAAALTQQVWLVAIAYLALVIPSAAYTTNITNTTYRFASLGGQRFASDLKTGAYAWLLLTNVLLLLATVGLAWPWIQIRLARYRLEHTALLATPDSFARTLGETQQTPSAIGEEVADFLDFDISL
jgi:uncharacterized membrane protein YjgN (DUF898 family)